MTMHTEIVKENDFVKVGDLSLAGFLFLYYPLETIERPQGSRKSYFIFKKDTHIDELITLFWRGQTNVEPQGYFNALRVIKARLYGE